MGMLMNLRGSTTFQVLSMFIKSKTKGQKIYFVPSPGNWGDALINQGSIQFFNFFGIDFITLTRSEIASRLTEDCHWAMNRTVVVGGGGGWCDNWSSTPEFVDLLSPSFADVIVLPTSLALPRTSPANVHLFRRDNGVSKEIYPRSMFCHDMAFFLDIRRRSEVEQLWRLNAFRGDLERSPVARDVPGAIDISLLGNSSHDVEAFFDIVNRFKEIHTDRLHVAIAGSMLQKKVLLYPGNYSKARDVWLATMADHYPHVDYLDWN